jgi:uncharacterized membrane protein YphA (DoxX/SURF4 family)
MRRGRDSMYDGAVRMLPRDYALLALRVALGMTFLFSNLDRFGLLGPPNTPGVSWGTFSRFTAYVGALNWFAPHGLIPIIAWTDTGLELLLALALILGAWLRLTAIASTVLLLAYAVAMGLANGIGAPFAYSVFIDAAAASVLAVASPWNGKLADL